MIDKCILVREILRSEVLKIKEDKSASQLSKNSTIDSIAKTEIALSAEEIEEEAAEEIEEEGAKIVLSAKEIKAEVAEIAEMLAEEGARSFKQRGSYSVQRDSRTKSN